MNVFGDLLESNFRTDLRIAKDIHTSLGVLGLELIGQSLFNSYPEYRREYRFEQGVFLKLSFSPD